MIERITFDEYFEHALQLNEAEVGLRAAILPQLPDTIIDSHVHAAPADCVDIDRMPEHILAHMMSTFPIASLEKSVASSELLTPGVEVRKLRFAHVFPGVDHKKVNDYLTDESPEADRVALFGLSDSDDDIEYTREELRTDKYSALKMYYIASDPPKYGLYEYFPEPILEVAEQKGTPIILHLPHSLYSSSEEVLDLAGRYPDLKIVLAHVGVAHVPRDELGAILSAFSEHTNIYADTARVHDERIVASAISHLGADHVLYGSDEPLNLLRSTVYFNPDLQAPRLLTDYPYHWVDPVEQERWRHLSERFVHSQWEQFEAILKAIDLLDGTATSKEAILEEVFSGNAKKVFSF
jgi:predicted TIM-barrel fold metal-dependent hydrolase